MGQDDWSEGEEMGESKMSIHHVDVTEFVRARMSEVEVESCVLGLYIHARKSLQCDL